MLTDRQDRILMVRAAAEDSGRWYLPGGGVEFGEDPEAGLRREVAEETGQVVADLRPNRVLSDVGVHKGAGLHSVRIIYRGTLAGERPLRNEAPGGSTVQVRWIPRHDVPGLDLAPFVLEALRALSSQ
ncbi:MAG: NUDIX domain-containing protein [Actinomycetales bacterium]|nr:NUDIX domain-containing protein [Actinomycetales bacterium]